MRSKNLMFWLFAPVSFPLWLVWNFLQYMARDPMDEKLTPYQKKELRDMWEEYKNRKRTS